MAAIEPINVTGGHLDQGNIPRLLNKLGDVAQAQRVDGQRPVQGLAEIHARRHIDHRVRSSGQLPEPAFGHAEERLRDLTGDTMDAVVQKAVEALRVLHTQPVEDRRRGHFVGETLGGSGVPTVAPDQQGDSPDLRYGTDQLFQDDFANEPGHPRDQHLFALELAKYVRFRSVGTRLHGFHGSPPGRGWASGRCRLPSVTLIRK